MSILNRLPFEWQVGIRYTRAGRRSGRSSLISFISLISMAGIVLGVAALIFVLSIVNGFQKEVRDRMLSVLSHVEIYDASGALPDWQATAREAFQNPEVKAAAPYVAAQAMMTREEAVRGVVIRGVLPEEEIKVSDVAAQMRVGKLDALRAGQFNIVLGKDLARGLKVQLNDRVTVITPQGQVTASGMSPQLRQFTVVGIFDAGHFEYDSTLAFIHMDDAMTMFHRNAPSGVRLKIADMQRAPQVAMALSQTLNGNMYIRDWTRQNRTWFAAVQSQKSMLFLILALIIGVAAFNLVSTLVMTVTDKQADIAILRTLGASPKSIMKIFTIQGALVGFFGVAMGTGLGVTIALNIDVIVPFFESILDVQFLSKDVYLISAVPSDLHWLDVCLIGGFSFILSLLATLYPSWWAARVKPAEALRYE